MEKKVAKQLNIAFKNKKVIKGKVRAKLGSLGTFFLKEEVAKVIIKKEEKKKKKVLKQLSIATKKEEVAKVAFKKEKKQLLALK